MRCKSMWAAALAVALAGHPLSVMSAETHMHDPASAAATDARQLVTFPEPMRMHTIASMRDHLSALQEINAALSMNDFDKAAGIAERRLGMSSLEAHGAAHVAPFMPKRMQDIGTQMHRDASRFAIEAQNASVGNDVRPALGALSKVMAQCVACHAAYRLH
jgi:hypothetical protein